MKSKRPCLSAGSFCISAQAAAARWQKRGKSKKIAPVKDGSDSRWQRKKDSNPHKRSQSPVCYHYTIPLRTNDIIQIFSDLSTLLSHIFHGKKNLCSGSACACKQSPSSGSAVENLAIDGDRDDLPRKEFPARAQRLPRRVLESAAAQHLHAHDGDALNVVAPDDLR